MTQRAQKRCVGNVARMDHGPSTAATPLGWDGGRGTGAEIGGRQLLMR